MSPTDTPATGISETDMSALRHLARHLDGYKAPEQIEEALWHAAPTIRAIAVADTHRIVPATLLDTLRRARDEAWKRDTSRDSAVVVPRDIWHELMAELEKIEAGR